MRPEIRPVAAADTYALRQQVLWPDRPLSYVQLPDDADGRHYGAFVGAELVSVVSLFGRGAEAQFRKFATHPGWQGRGIGSALLRHLLDEAARHGARRLWCDARQEKAGFYRRFGFEVEGVPFYKGPIPYVRMARGLSRP